MTKVALKSSFLNDAAGYLLAGCGILFAAWGQEIVGWLTCYVGLVLLSASIHLDDQPWLQRLWSRGAGYQVVLMLIGLAIPAMITWMLWPPSYQVAYQLCYRYDPVLDEHKKPAVGRVILGARVLNAGDAPVYAKVGAASLSLGGISDDKSMGDDVEPITNTTRNYYVLKEIRFDPPRPPGGTLEGQFRFPIAFDHSRDGRFKEQMNIEGVWAVTPIQGGRDGFLQLGFADNNDTRRIERECHINFGR